MGPTASDDRQRRRSWPQVAGAIALVGVAAACATTGDRSRAIELHRAALSRFATTKDAGATGRELQAAVAADPSFANPRFDLGVLAEGEGDWAAAARWFEECARLSDPRSEVHQRAEVRARRARAAAELDSTPEGKAIREYADALVQASTSLEAGDSFLAYVWSARAAEIEPRLAYAYLLGAAALAEAGAVDRASAFVRMGMARVSDPVARAELESVLGTYEGNRPMDRDGK